MKQILVVSTFFVLACFSMSSFAVETDRIVMEFSAATAEENKVTIMGAGFGQYPQAAVAFGYIPTDNAFDGATDGQGAIVTAKPGEGVMVFGQKIATNQAAIIRCSVRTDKPTASVIIATIGDEPDTFVTTTTPTNKGYFTGQYLRLQTSCTPPSTGFQPVIQILNTSKTELLTAYLDNFEVYLLDPNRYTSNAFLDGDESDPPADKISIPSEAEAGAVSPSDISVKIGQIVTEVFMEMVLIPAGTFTMGAPDSEQNRFNHEGPQHQVTISKPFYFGKYEVTQEQWAIVMGSNPASNYGVGLKYPVYNVSWDDCQTFIAKLNQMGQGTFRLPTEAEWEYACRAGTQTAFYWGEDNSYSQIGSYARYYKNSGGKAHEVGGKLPNAWGLFDMIGNVREWCQDGFEYYNYGPKTDPILTGNGSSHMTRGGNWDDDPPYLRSANRYMWDSDSPNKYQGFRVVLVKT